MRKLLVLGVIGAALYFVGKKAAVVGMRSAKAGLNRDQVEAPTVLECWAVHGPFSKHFSTSAMFDCFGNAAKGIAEIFPDEFLGVSVEVAGETPWEPNAS